MNPLQNERTYTMLLLNDSIVIHFLLSLSRNFVQPSLQLRLFSDNVSTSISFGRRFFFFCEFLPCTKVSSFFSTLSRKCFDGKFSLLFPLLFSHSLSNTIYKFRTTFFMFLHRTTSGTHFVIWYFKYKEWKILLCIFLFSFRTNVISGVNKSRYHVFNCKCQIECPLPISNDETTWSFLNRFFFLFEKSCKQKKSVASRIWKLEEKKKTEAKKKSTQFYHDRIPQQRIKTNLRKNNGVFFFTFELVKSF